MTDLADIIDARAVLPSVKAQGKKQLLADLSQAMAKFVAVDHRIIFETLLTREKLGSTGIGQGIAIPHGKTFFHQSRLWAVCTAECANRL